MEEDRRVRRMCPDSAAGMRQVRAAVQPKGASLQ